jgi:hypothetical protein
MVVHKHPSLLGAAKGEFMVLAGASFCLTKRLQWDPYLHYLAPCVIAWLWLGATCIWHHAQSHACRSVEHVFNPHLRLYAKSGTMIHLMSVYVCVSQPEVKVFALTGSPADVSQQQQHQQQQQRTARQDRAQPGQQQQQRQQPASLAPVLTAVLTLRGADQVSNAPTAAAWLPGPCFGGNSSNGKLTAHNSSRSSQSSHDTLPAHITSSINSNNGQCAAPNSSSNSSSSNSSGGSSSHVDDQSGVSGSPAVAVCGTLGLLVSWPNHVVLFTWDVTHTGELLLLLPLEGGGHQAFHH